MYAKLFASLYQGTMRGQSDLLLVFTALLAHADKEGHVDIHPRAIAEAVGVSIDRVRSALDALEAPDPESRSAEEDGRRLIRIDEHRAWGWVIVNYCKYRAIRSEEDRREQNKRAQEKWRERARLAADSKQYKPPSAGVSRDKPPSAHTEVEVEVEEKKRAPKGAGAVAPSRKVLAPDDVSSEVWEDWLTLRKAKRAPVTATVLSDARSEATKAGMSLEAFFREWCSRGSQGLRADWLKTNGRGKQSDVFEGAL